MGEEPGAGDTPVTDEGNREPEEIRRDIESTRGELGDTVAALAEKTDVKSRAQQKIAGVKETVGAKGATIKETVGAKRTELVGKARESSPDSASSAAASAKAKARDNPLPVAAAGAFLVGVIVGRTSKR